MKINTEDAKSFLDKDEYGLYKHAANYPESRAAIDPNIAGVMKFDKEGDFKPISSELSEKLKDFSSIPNQAIQSMHKDLSKQFEDQIILALSRHGFSFGERGELKQFCGSERCEMQIRNEIKTLLVDNKPICEWDMKPQVKTNSTDKDYSISVEYNFFKIFD